MYINHHASIRKHRIVSILKLPLTLLKQVKVWPLYIYLYIHNKIILMRMICDNLYQYNEYVCQYITRKTLRAKLKCCKCTGLMDVLCIINCLHQHLNSSMENIRICNFSNFEEGGSRTKGDYRGWNMDRLITNN